MISVLCVMPGSNYYKIDGLDLWDKQRDAYNFVGLNPVITHAPCQQWSKLKAFAKVDKREKDLAVFCLDKVIKNGGIFEHPAGSSFFKFAGVKPSISINQSWFGFNAKKSTYLYYCQLKPLQFPLNFDLVKGKVENMSSKARSKMTLEFCQWLVNHFQQ